MEKKNFFSTNLGILIATLICCSLWGSAMPGIKSGYNFLSIESSDKYTILLFAGLRFFLAGIMVILFAGLSSKSIPRLKKESIKLVILLALFQTFLQYMFFYNGLAHTSGVKGAIINGTNTFFCIILSCLIFKLESLNVKKVLGCILGFMGVVLINLSNAGDSTSLELSFSFLGEGFVLLSRISGAVSTVLIRIFSQKENPVVLSGYQFALGGFCLIIVGLIGGGHFEVFNIQGCLTIVYLAMVSAVAYSLWSILLKYNPVSKISVFGFMTPIFGVLFSAIILQETSQLNITMLLSLVLVCFGIFIVNHNWHSHK